jgi:hypothetical protein
MKFRSFLLFFVLVFGAVSTVSAQRERTLFRTYGFSGIWGGSKHQVAQFGDTRSYMRGGHFGLEFGKSLLIGVSHMDLKSDPNWDELQDQAFDLRWNGGTIGYGFQTYKAIHPMINVDFGPGKVRFDNQEDRIFAIQPSAGVEINVFRWLHLGLEGGYRFINDSNIDGFDDQKLSGAFGQATLRFGWSWGKSNHKKKTNKSDAPRQKD